MAVLGTGGRLVLKRKAPEPFLVSSREVDYDRNHLQESAPGYWTGDKVSTLTLPHWPEQGIHTRRSKKDMQCTLALSGS